MPRIARLVAVGYPHHITQRGNYQQKTFRNKKDFLQYLSWIEKYSKKYLLSILAYCLMPNHIHFIVVPEKENSLAEVFGVAHGQYSQLFNKRHNLRGHLWQDRFYSCVLDEKHLYTAVRYVERNPVEAGLVQCAEDWRWSSAYAHIRELKGKDKNGVTLVDINELIGIDDWEKYLSEENKDDMFEEIEKHTLTGRPLGDKNFIKHLESVYNRKLTIFASGRPRKGLNKAN